MTTYTDYRNALAGLRDHPSEVNAALQAVKQTHDQAAGLADRAVTTAATASADALKTVEAQLATAGTILEPLGKQSLIPSRMRASSSAAPATSKDMSDTQSALIRAVNQLRVVTDAEIVRQAAERERLAREAAARAEAERLAAARAAAAAARRKRVIQISAAVGIVVVMLIVILIL